VGFNTTIVICNDAMHEIAKDPHFGQKVSDAASQHISAQGPQYFAYSSKIVAQHHADGVSINLVGGNTGKCIGTSRRGDGSWARGNEQEIVRILREVAADYGYRLSKIPESQKKPWQKPYAGAGWFF
jgi:hypothetical protein